MPTIRLHTKELTTPAGALSAFHKKRLKSGDTIYITSEGEPFALSIILMATVLYFTNKARGGREFTDRVLKDLFAGKPEETLIKGIEAKYKINIKVKKDDSDERSAMEARDVKAAYAEKSGSETTSDFQSYLLNWPKMSDEELASINARTKRFNEWR